MRNVNQFKQYFKSPKYKLGFSGGSDSKESAYNEGYLGSIPGLERCPGGKVWQLTPVFLPGESS